MNRKQILERESRWRHLAGFSAIAIAPLYLIASAIDPQNGTVPFTGVDTERYRVIDENAAAILGAAGLRALALALIAIPLLYLFRAAQVRSERVSAPMIGFVFIGPILYAIQTLLVAVAQTQVASDFVGQLAPGGDIYTLLDDLIDDSTLFQVGVSLVFPAVLGLLVAMIYVPLQAQRVGLLTRFFATLGMALGASVLFISPVISLLALVLWFGWLGFVIIDRVPRGRPPAWDAGEAVPWTRPGDEPAEGKPAVVEGDASRGLRRGARAARPFRSARAGEEAQAQAPRVSTPIVRHRLAIRGSLGALGAIQASIGLYALLAPRSFYEDFPVGRGWVEALPAYNEHLLRDVGALFCAIGLLAIAAAWIMDRTLVAAAAATYLVFAIPHTIYHYLNLEPYGAGDAIANAITLAATVLVPAWILFELVRGNRDEWVR